MVCVCLTPPKPCKAPFCAIFVQVSRLWCLGLFTTEILRDFSGGDGALKSPKGEGHPLSLLSLKGTLFGLLREHHVRVCIDHVLAVFHAYYAMI